MYALYKLCTLIRRVKCAYQLCTWCVKCACDLCVVWVRRFRKYTYVILRVRMFWSIHTYFNVRWGYLYPHTPLEAVLETKPTSTWEAIVASWIWLCLVASWKYLQSDSLCQFGKIEIVLSATCFLKWWYLIAICFVLGVNFELSETMMQPLLSSNTLQWKSCFGLWRGKTLTTSTIKFMNGIITHVRSEERRA